MRAFDVVRHEKIRPLLGVIQYGYIYQLVMSLDLFPSSHLVAFMHHISPLPSYPLGWQALQDKRHIHLPGSCKQWQVVDQRNPPQPPQLYLK